MIRCILRDAILLSLDLQLNRWIDKKSFGSEIDQLESLISKFASKSQGVFVDRNFSFRWRVSSQLHSIYVMYIWTILSKCHFHKYLKVLWADFFPFTKISLTHVDFGVLKPSNRIGLIIDKTDIHMYMYGLFACNWGESPTHGGLRTRKLGQSPIGINWLFAASMILTRASWC